jgi:hypothetical protein
MSYQTNIDIDNIPNMNNMNNANNIGNMNNMNNQNNLNNINNINDQNNLNNMNNQNNLNNAIHPNNINTRAPDNYINNNSNNFQFKSQNNLQHAMKTIDELSLKGTDLEENAINNLSHNETLIKSITDEITTRLGADKNLIDNKDIKKEKSKDTKSQKKTEHMNNTENVAKSVSVMEKIINYNDVKDFAILFVVFFLLSQDMIKDFFSEYINCIGGDDEGKVNIKGVIIYGIILSILFLTVRKFI